MKTKKRGRGRPPGPAEQRRTAELRIRLTDAERATLDVAAQARDMDTSTWARERLLALAAKGPLR